MRNLRLAGIAVAFAGLVAGASADLIQFDGAVFRASGWNGPSSAPARGWPSVFAIYTGSPDVPPLSGSYAVEGGALIFRPAYPIAPGVHYRAVFHPPAGGAPIEKMFDGPPKPTNPVARVEHVYPSGDVWPSNQLRLYIYFSAAMSRAEAAQHIHVLDPDGKDLSGPQGVFLPGEELWDPGFERLTMTFDPGRIKRGLTSNVTAGPPIVEGKRYTLVIDREWPDARGVPMVEGFRKTFRGGPALRTPPDPKQWRISAPKTGTREALIVDFTAPMNYPLLQRMLQVSGPGGRIAGNIEVAREEREWRLIPREPWTPGKYELVVDTGLEDLAGNHIGQPFDLDVFDHVTEHIDTKTVSLPFTIR